MLTYNIFPMGFQIKMDNIVIFTELTNANEEEKIEMSNKKITEIEKSGIDNYIDKHIHSNRKNKLSSAETLMGQIILNQVELLLNQEKQEKLISDIILNQNGGENNNDV